MTLSHEQDQQDEHQQDQQDHDDTIDLESEAMTATQLRKAVTAHGEPEHLPANDEAVIDLEAIERLRETVS